MAKQWISNGVEFKVGDKVRVMRQVEEFDNNGMGEGVTWENTWLDEMDQLLGHTFEIADIDSHGVEFVTEGLCYLFPLAALDKV